MTRPQADPGREAPTRDGTDLVDHRAAARMFASGVTVAAADDGQEAHAITAIAFCSLSLDPPLVLLAVATEGRLLRLMRRAGHVGVSVLGADQMEIGEWASLRGRPRERTLRRVDTAVLTTGAPLLRGAIAWFDCRLESISEHGDHTVIIGRVLDAWSADGAPQPLLYFQGGYHAIGERIGEHRRTPDSALEPPPPT